MLYWAKIDEMGTLPDFEIAEAQPFDRLPDEWTYPDIQPYLIEKVKKVMETKGVYSDESL